MENNTQQLLDLTGNAEVIVKYNGNIKRLEQELNVEVEILEFNYAIITLKPEQLNELYNYTEIEYIELPKTVAFNVAQEQGSICLPTLANSVYDLSRERNYNCSYRFRNRLHTSYI